MGKRNIVVQSISQQTITELVSPDIACSNRSDSVERCEVKKAMKSRGGLGREVREHTLSHLSSSLAFIFSRSLLLHTAPHYLNAWNRLRRTWKGRLTNKRHPLLFLLGLQPNQMLKNNGGHQDVARKSGGWGRGCWAGGGGGVGLAYVVYTSWLNTI